MRPAAVQEHRHERGEQHRDQELRLAAQQRRHLAGAHPPGEQKIVELPAKRQLEGERQNVEHDQDRAVCFGCGLRLDPRACTAC